ncbi:glycosyltransferase [Nonlabens agnitus]|uniref:Uncharacterized protein n=1 Tax=Nonlabens agnitus TaxID=870484 RepID=A0A2S9WU48_9FLAO|nr:glycosyltransferase [Nonlabens agnitus]PRP67000.1 hypothetical protein BST86_07755 [Nonlabens agnitus]
MKILLVNTFDRGGAANACIRLHLALLDHGIDSKLLLKKKTKSIPQSFQYSKATVSKSKLNKIWGRFSRLISISLPVSLRSSTRLSVEDEFLRGRDKRLSLFSFPGNEIDITESPFYKEADIINFHWVAKFIDFQSFFEKNSKPLVWTLHDMNPFTGGEHYQDQILGLNHNDEPIIRRLTVAEQEVHQEIIKIKALSLLSVQNIQIVAPSKWLLNESSNSRLFKKFKHHHIVYGLESSSFKAVSQKFARKLLGLPKNKKILLFLAESTSDKRKGLDFLLSALKKIKNSELIVCAVGETNNRLADVENIYPLGYIGDPRLLNLCYSAADVFVIPSLMDNLPNTVIESLFCGTPVIGFRVGGIIDMVQHEENGLIADELTSEALKDRILDFFRDPSRFERKKIRANAISKYSASLQAARYLKLFGSLSSKV